MTRKLTDDEKALRRAARRAAAERQVAYPKDQTARDPAEERFNSRSTRESVGRSILHGYALTLEEYRVAEGRGLVGSGITNSPHEAMPISYDGPHQYRWDPGSWHGFTKLSASRAINNAGDTYESDWRYEDDDPWSDTAIDAQLLADEESVANEDEWYWSDARDEYDMIARRAGGSDLTDGEYRNWWGSQSMAYLEPDRASSHAATRSGKRSLVISTRNRPRTTRRQLGRSGLSLWRSRTSVGRAIF